MFDRRFLKFQNYWRFKMFIFQYFFFPAFLLQFIISIIPISLPLHKTNKLFKALTPLTKWWNKILVNTSYMQDTQALCVLQIRTGHGCCLQEVCSQWERKVFIPQIVYWFSTNRNWTVVINEAIKRDICSLPFLNNHQMLNMG